MQHLLLLLFSHAGPPALLQQPVPQRRPRSLHPHALAPGTPPSRTLESQKSQHIWQCTFVAISRTSRFVNGVLAVTAAKQPACHAHSFAICHILRLVRWTLLRFRGIAVSLLEAVFWLPNPLAAACTSVRQPTMPSWHAVACFSMLLVAATATCIATANAAAAHASAPLGLYHSGG